MTCTKWPTSRYLIERAAAAMSNEDIAELGSVCDAMDAATDHDAWLRLNREFHDRLYSHARSTFAVEQADLFAERVRRMAGRRVDRSAEANAEHRRILDAVAQGDVRRARLELEMHLSHTRNEIVEVFRRMETATGDDR